MHFPPVFFPPDSSTNSSFILNQKKKREHTKKSRLPSPWSGHVTPSSKAPSASPISALSKSLPHPSSTVKDLCRGIFKSFKQKLSRRDRTHCTGHTLDFQRRRDDNAKNNRLYGLPTELFLRIMSYLGPVELYVARQSCALFMRAFEVHDFSDFHRYVAGDKIRQDLDRPRRELEFPLCDMVYSVIHQRFRASEARHEPAPAGACRPIVELDRGLVSEAEEREMAKLVRRLSLPASPGYAALIGNPAAALARERR